MEENEIEKTNENSGDWELEKHRSLEALSDTISIRNNPLISKFRELISKMNGKELEYAFNILRLEIDLEMRDKKGKNYSNYGSVI